MLQVNEYQILFTKLSSLFETKLLAHCNLYVTLLNILGTA